MAARDWAQTPLGPIDGWSGGLRSTVSLLLASRAQIVMFWGPEFVALYNDAYAPTIGDKHPAALGGRAQDHWSELWDDLGPLLEGVRQSGESFHASDRPFFIDRHGFLERVFFDVSYDPVRADSGEVEGIFCIVAETTRRVLAERRLRALRELGDALDGLREADVGEQAPGLLVSAEPDGDVVFAQLHLTSSDGLLALVGNAGPAPRTDATLAAVLGADGAVTLPAADVVEDVPPGVRDEVIAVPVRAGSRTVGVLVAGTSAHLAPDADLVEHLRAIGERIARVVVDDRIHRLERARAARSAEIAQVLQRAILPDRLPVIAGARSAARYLAGTSDVEVGGDWYDLLEVSEGVAALAIGDVGGRGVDAAAEMAQLRNALRAYLAGGRSPGAALADLRRYAARLDVAFCTAACVVVDLRTGAATLANAGHPPPLLCAAGTDPAWLAGAPSPPLGPLEVDDQPELSFVVPAGGTVLLYTDGLVERRGQSLSGRLDRLAAVAAETGPTPEPLAAALLDELAGGDDDTAFLALQRQGTP